MVSFDATMRPLLEQSSNNFRAIELEMLKLPTNRRIEIAVHDLQELRTAIDQLCQSSRLIDPQLFQLDRHMVHMLDSIDHNNFGVVGYNSTFSSINALIRTQFKIIEEVNAATLKEKLK